MKKKLPSKWCVRVEENSQPKYICEWRATYHKGYGDYWKNPGYLSNDGMHTKTKPVDRIELTLEEFKTLVLKEKPEDYTYLIEFFKKLNIE